MYGIRYKLYYPYKCSLELVALQGMITPTKGGTATDRMGLRKSTEVGKKGSHMVHVPENRQRTSREVEKKDWEDRRR